MNLVFFINSILLGVGLAMDAFSVSIANGLNEPRMSLKKMLGIGGCFGFFQAAMPMIGWIIVHNLANHFKTFEKVVPYIALILLVLIGGKMIYDGIKNDEESQTRVGVVALLIQGVATSIDAFSVGFTISGYNFVTALVCVVIIAIVTFIISVVGVIIGKKVGNWLSNKARIFGGIILIALGIEIFLQ